MKIKLFSALREAAGQDEISLPWKQGMTYLDLLEQLKKNFHPRASLLEYCFVAVNGRYAERETVLLPEDEVAVLPPVSGG